MSDLPPDQPVYPDFPQTLPQTEFQNDSSAHPDMQPPWPGPSGAHTTPEDMPEPGVTVTSVTPNTGPANTVTSILVGGTRLASVKQVYIGRSCHNTVALSDTQIDTDTPGNQGAGTFDVVVEMADGGTVTGPSFTYT